MFILGISAFYHDSAACLIRNGEIVAAAQEERFTRIKHDPRFPASAIKYCLKQAQIEPREIEHVVFYEKPFLKFERLLETYLAFAPRGFSSFSKSMPLWIKDKIFQKNKLINELNCSLTDSVEWRKKILFSEHHLSHAASAFYPSPFQNAAVLTLDGVGEWTTTSIALGNKNKLQVQQKINFPHSIGLLYSAFTYYSGFKVNSGEYKLMGLAPYGEPKYAGVIKENLINLAGDGSFQLNMEYFDFATGLTMTNAKFDQLFGMRPRCPESQITQREMDLAASIQKVTEEIVLNMVREIARNTGEQNLCLAGGVALNCVANGVIQRANIFDGIWVQPAAGDAGGALGAALSVWHLHCDGERNLIEKSDAMKGAYLGPEFDDFDIQHELDACDAVYKKLPEDDLLDVVVDALVEGKAVGWLQGRMEFGPRALGARSIIADPRSSKMQRQLNLKVKFRESFRPFAPSILEEDAKDWFNLSVDSPYMLFVADVLKDRRLEMTEDEQCLFGIDKLNVQRSMVPAVTHVDYSARVQTVHKRTNPRYHSLIYKFKEKTGCPILVNTSFNIRGEPIVCTPSDAFRCFMGTDLDLLVIEDFLLLKRSQVSKREKEYAKKFELD